MRRVATPVIKYWTCKRAPVHAVEALECLGGAGYVEESGLPRLFRQSSLNGIWEGSGNVICLDVLRVMARNPESVEVLLGELAGATGHDPRLDAALKDIQQELTDLDQIVLRYEDNPNGSFADVAGVCNREGNVLGLMPHPEHAVDPLLGSADGALILASLVDAARDREGATV